MLQKFSVRRYLSKSYHRQQIIVKWNVGALFGVFALIGKQVLAVLPNFQIVTFWLMMVSTVFALSVVFVTINSFCWLNVILNGLASWSLIYFFIFNLLGLFGILTRRIVLRWWWLAIGFWMVSGYLFGFIYALFHALLFKSIATGIAYEILGIWFDTANAFSTALFTYFLFKPIVIFFSNAQFQRLEYLFNRHYLIHVGL